MGALFDNMSAKVAFDLGNERLPDPEEEDSGGVSKDGTVLCR